MTPNHQAATPTAQCFGLQLSEVALCEMDGTRVAVQVVRKEIRSVELYHGLAAERPFLTVALGLVLVLWGAFFLRDLVLWHFHGGTAYDFEAFAVALIPLGAWLIHYAFRKRYILKVTSDSTTRKLAFTAAATVREAKEFAVLVGQTVPCHARIALRDRAAEE